MDVEELTSSFAIDGVLAFERKGELVRARITTEACSAELYLQGAQVTAWQPAGQAPVLFVSDAAVFVKGKAIRGGIPVVFPWFADRTAWEGSPRTDGPAHGFARTSEWQMVFAGLAGNDLHLTLTLGPTDRSRELGWDGFRLIYEVALGAELRVRLTVVNESDAPMRLEEALHTYLAVGDVRQISIGGLAGTEYLDKTDDSKRKQQVESPIRLTAETDRPYLGTTVDVTVDDPAAGRRIKVAKQNSRTTVVWNPWEELAAKLPDMTAEGWQRMVCVETANAGEDAVVLAPQQAHTMQAVISVEALKS